MKGNILCSALMLLLFLVRPLHFKEINYIISIYEKVVPLSLVPDSVDDMYSGCQEEMRQKVKHEYFRKEYKGELKKAWKKAENCVKKNLKLKEDEDRALTKEHLQAICVYTSEHQKIYDLFNAAVRTQRAEYGTTFQYHSLHFWLTSAIQLLNSNKKCFTSYRRSKMKFTGKVNQMIRFGFFASSSKSPHLTHFGTETCFEIKTCYGAYLKKYPRIGDKEEEVLIPPYEMFKISKPPEKKSGNLEDCNIVFDLESIGFCSNLNCKAAKLGQ